MDLAIKNDRACSRRPTNIEITLVAHHSIPFHGMLRNISFNGGYVETGNRALPPQTPLTIVMQKDEGDVQRIYRMNATVVRQDQAGAGIRFDDYDPDTVRSLRTIYKSTLE